MKLLYDENLSPKLVAALADIFPNSAHVDRVGLGSESDDDVWEYAKNNRYVLISKDADFYDKSNLFGHPPKIIWIRRGNCSNRQIQLLLRNKTDAIHLFNDKSKPIVYSDIINRSGNRKDKPPCYSNKKVPME